MSDEGRIENGEGIPHGFGEAGERRRRSGGLENYGHNVEMREFFVQRSELKNDFD